MAFCSNCGQQLDEKANFCFACGASRPIQQTEHENKRSIVYEGEIRKCPNCGEVIGAFIARCSACGFELNSKKVSSALQDFIEEINKCEKAITNKSTVGKDGWSSWNKSKRLGWVLLNILFLCIPLVFYLALPLITIKSTPKLTREEKRMVSLIENFPFPNDRESILSALVFTKEKIDFISKETINRKTAYWMRLWCAKAEQLRQKADLLFPNDPIVQDSCYEITADEKHVNNVIRVKAIAGLVLLTVAISFLFVRNGTFRDLKVANTMVEIPETELSALMPQIEGGKGKITTNNDKYFAVDYVGISDAEFETYKKECKNKGFTIDCKNTGSLFDAYNEDGYNIRITYFDSKMHITVEDDLEMRIIVWPSSKVADLIPVPGSDYGKITSSSDTCLIVYIGNMTIDDYVEYVNECIKKGFDQKMVQSDEYYHADNKEGCHIQVEYRGFNTVFIRVDDQSTKER